MLTPAESTNESASAADSDGRLLAEAPGEGVALGGGVCDGVADAAGVGRDDAPPVGGEEETPAGGEEAATVGLAEACGFSDGVLPGPGVLVDCAGGAGSPWVDVSCAGESGKLAVCALLHALNAAIASKEVTALRN